MTTVLVENVEPPFPNRRPLPKELRMNPRFTRLHECIRLGTQRSSARYAR